VARHEGRVVFVRHTLPGERVLARLTEAGERDRYWRADCVEVLTPSPDRAPSRCALAGPGGCGGCDWQHVTTAGQRRLKADVVAEQLRRLGGLEGVAPQVEPVPGDDDGLGWRTRVRFAVDARGRPGLRAHRSHEVVPVDRCPIAHGRVAELEVGTRTWTDAAEVEVVAPAGGTDRLVVVHPLAADRAVGVPPLAGPAGVVLDGGRAGLRRLRGRTWVEEQVVVDGVTRRFRVTGTGFWQVHPGAAQALLDAVLEAGDPQPGERALDLYSGVGLFSAGLALRVGPQGSVTAVESDARASADARRSLHDLPQVHLEHQRVDRALAVRGALPPAEVVVLDPPRVGAGRGVLEAVLARHPRVAVYVACDPAALARDLAVAARRGYRLDRLRAFDLFPMTHHVECVARLVPDTR
jgi:tRNA/tmRNA/rRNA uracil-C5-methylase (TrmA/RlmC/RlmD family)